MRKMWSGIFQSRKGRPSCFISRSPTKYFLACFEILASYFSIVSDPIDRFDEPFQNKHISYVTVSYTDSNI